MRKAQSTTSAPSSEPDPGPECAMGKSTNTAGSNTATNRRGDMTWADADADAEVEGAAGQSSCARCNVRGGGKARRKGDVGVVGGNTGPTKACGWGSTSAAATRRGAGGAGAGGAGGGGGGGCCTDGGGTGCGVRDDNGMVVASATVDAEKEARPTAAAEVPVAAGATASSSSSAQETRLPDRVVGAGRPSDSS